MTTYLNRDQFERLDKSSLFLTTAESAEANASANPHFEAIRFMSNGRLTYGVSPKEAVARVTGATKRIDSANENVSTPAPLAGGKPQEVQS